MQTLQIGVNVLLRNRLLRFEVFLFGTAISLDSKAESAETSSRDKKQAV